MAGRMISFRGNGDTYQGYLATPNSGHGIGVIVIQEWWGLVGHIKAVADRFAEAGFTALAPDFYKGEIAEEPDAAGKLMMALNIDETAKIAQGAISALLEQPETLPGRVGTVGFCMGGQLSMLAATVDGRVGACVNFYGIHPNVQPDFSRLQGPMLGLFAEEDAYANAETVAGLSKSLQAAGKAHTFHTFPGTKHAFFNDERPEVYDPEASAKAWAMATEFFRANLP